MKAAKRLAARAPLASVIFDAPELAVVEGADEVDDADAEAEFDDAEAEAEEVAEEPVAVADAPVEVAVAVAEPSNKPASEVATFNRDDAGPTKPLGRILMNWFATEATSGTAPPRPPKRLWISEPMSRF